MACSVTINSPHAHTVAGNVVDIEITGTASVPDCNAVKVELNCSGFPATTTVPVDAAGNWTVLFTTADPLVLDNCPCGQGVTVFVQCLNNISGVPSQPVAGCNAKWSGALPCEPACPDVNWLSPQPSPKCNPDGTRDVSNLGAVVINPSLPLIVAQLEWVEGNNLVLDGPKPGAGQVNLGPVTHAFPSGQQTLHVSVSTPLGCGGGNCPPFDVAPCGPVGACCHPVSGVPNAMVCEELTKPECDAIGGDWKGPGTKCDQVDCGGQPPPPSNGKPSCGDGLVWAAALALAAGLLLLGIWNCFPAQVKAFAIAASVFLIFLSALLMLIWALFGFFNKCKLDMCHAAAIFLLVLSILAVVLAILNPILNTCCAMCFWTPVWWALAAAAFPWGLIASACVLKNA